MAHPVSPDNLESAAHEKDQVSIRGIGWFAIWFVVSAIVIHTAIWIVYRGLQNHDLSQDVADSALAKERTPPPEPRLQRTKDAHERLPAEDLDVMLRHEDEEFAKRGWTVDDQTHQVKISPETIRQVTGGTNR